MVNHIALYRDEFVRLLPQEARVLELASGHGVLGLLAAEERSDIRLEGIDISPPAVAVANRLLDVSGGRLSGIRSRKARGFESSAGGCPSLGIDRLSCPVWFRRRIF